MTTTIKDALLERGRKSKVVPVQLDDLTIYVRRMTAGERTVYRREVFAAQDSTDKSESIDMVQRGILVRALCDENGVRLFADDDTLEAFDPLDLDTLQEAASKLNERKVKEAVEEQSKNSQETTD